MSEATKTKKDDRDVIARLAERGEQTIAKLGDLPGGTKALKAVNDLRARVDELGRKVRGIDELEQRVAKLEKEVAAARASAHAGQIEHRAVTERLPEQFPAIEEINQILIKV